MGGGASLWPQGPTRRQFGDQSSLSLRRADCFPVRSSFYVFPNGRSQIIEPLETAS